MERRCQEGDPEDVPDWYRSQVVSGLAIGEPSRVEGEEEIERDLPRVCGSSAPNGGRSRRREVARHSLVAFVRNAYPNRQWPLSAARPSLTGASPTRPSQSQLRHLRKRRRRSTRAPGALNPRSRPTKKPEGAKKRAAEANATVVERKKRHMLINLSSAKSRIICWECSGTGHTQAFHQKFLQRQVDPADDTEAHAQLADDDSDHDKEMAEEDEHVDEE
ncbi:hypothetical protein L917_18814 [Phytophthora nicotianae]|uniref:Uncharacterized protein n=1 Tax=Phytophthora nicotianae TaxID=4792 RepID=W2K6I0_PHYNI|nr:hypothetical protein L917_18814 [Phytophthora nicotianae]